jgi:hypothetical protein
MNAFISILLNITGGIIALIFTVLFLVVMIVGALKVFRLLIALLNYSIAEPEAAIVRSVQKLNITAAKKTAKKKSKGEK